MTSAGQILPLQAPPHFVVIERSVLCFAHVTHQMGRINSDFAMGVADGAQSSLRVIALAATSWCAGRLP
jgi:hypothetical protein